MHEIGREIVRIMDYKGLNKKRIYYKTDIQTKKGTQATGVPAGSNHLYSLEIPSLELESWEAQRPKSSWAIYHPFFDNRETKYPSIRLKYKPEHLDEAWLKAKDLMDAELLPPECVQVQVEKTIKWIHSLH